MTQPDAFRTARILVDHALATHGEDIALIFYYGSHAKGTARPTSDLDIAYIPDEGEADSLYSSFVLDGLPYEFWPVSWRFLEDIAGAAGGRPWPVAHSLLAYAQVLYARSAADRERFEALRARSSALALPEAGPIMLQKSLEEYKALAFRLNHLRQAAASGDAASLRFAAWPFAHSLLACLGLLNQRPLDRGWAESLEEGVLPRAPERLREGMEAVVFGPAGAALSEATRLADEARRLLLEAQDERAATVAAGDLFADFYPYVYEYRQKIIAACERGDRFTAAQSAYLLQKDIAQMLHQVTSGVYPRDLYLAREYSEAYAAAGLPDMLEAASTGELGELAARARLLDDRFRAWLAMHGIATNELSDDDDLRRFLRERAAPRDAQRDDQS